MDKNLNGLQVAIRAGDLLYLTDNPCKYDHEPVRYVASRACVECQRLARQRYRDNVLSGRKEAASHG